jgi:hypothetical protein
MLVKDQPINGSFNTNFKGSLWSMVSKQAALQPNHVFTSTTLKGERAGGNFIKCTNVA